MLIINVVQNISDSSGRDINKCLNRVLIYFEWNQLNVWNIFILNCLFYAYKKDLFVRLTFHTWYFFVQMHQFHNCLSVYIHIHVCTYVYMHLVPNVFVCVWICMFMSQILKLLCLIFNTCCWIFKKKPNQNWTDLTIKHSWPFPELSTSLLQGSMPSLFHKNFVFDMGKKKNQVPFVKLLSGLDFLIVCSKGF